MDKIMDKNIINKIIMNLIIIKAINILIKDNTDNNEI
jgi:hypothetical protein